MVVNTRRAHCLAVISLGVTIRTIVTIAYYGNDSQMLMIVNLLQNQQRVQGVAGVRSEAKRCGHSRNGSRRWPRNGHGMQCQAGCSRSATLYSFTAHTAVKGIGACSPPGSVMRSQGVAGFCSSERTAELQNCSTTGNCSDSVCIPFGQTGRFVSMDRASCHLLV